MYGLAPLLALLCASLVAAEPTFHMTTLPLGTAGPTPALHSVCTEPGAGCPHGAMAWAAGTFTEQLTTTGIRKGGLRLTLALCCNYTYTPAFMAVPASPDSTESRELFSAFTSVLVDSGPAELLAVKEALFSPRALRFSDDLSVVELTTTPIPQFPTLPRQGQEVGTVPAVALAIANFVLNCKCPNTLRVLPPVRVTHDRLPSLRLPAARTHCLDEVPAHVDILIDGAEALPDVGVTRIDVTPPQPHAPETFFNVSGVRLHHPPRGVAHTIAAAAAVGSLEWDATATFAWERRYTMGTLRFVHGDAASVLFATSAVAELPEGPEGTQVSCTLPYGRLNATHVSFNSLRSGRHHVVCRAKDALGACPAQMSAAVLLVATADIAGPTTVCEEEATVEARPFPADFPADVAASITAAWRCAHDDDVVEGAGFALRLRVMEGQEWECRFSLSSAADGSLVSSDTTVVRRAQVARLPPAEVLTVTTKDLALPLTAPTPEGRWEFNDTTPLPFPSPRGVLATWVVGTAPCAGLRWHQPIRVVAAPPSPPSAPALHWSNCTENCAMIVPTAPPAADEQGRFELAAEQPWSLVSRSVDLAATGGRHPSVSVCGVRPGDCVVVNWTVSTDAGEASAQTTVCRCACPAEPRFTEAMAERSVVAGAVVLLEAENPASLYTRGRWATDRQGVTIEEPEAIRTTARGLRGNTTFTWTVESTTEHLPHAKPLGFCPVRSASLTVFAAFGECPAIDSCSDAVESPFFDRALAAKARPAFAVECNSTAVAASVDPATGIFKASGLPHGVTDCVVTTRVGGRSDTCSVLVRRRSALPTPTLALPTVSVGRRSVPVSAKVDLTDVLTQPELIFGRWNTTRTYHDGGSDYDYGFEHSQVVTLHGEGSPHPEQEHMWAVDNVTESRTLVTFTLSDGLCPSTSVQSSVEILEARIESNVTTCFNFAKVKALPVPPALQDRVSMGWALAADRSAAGCSAVTITDERKSVATVHNIGNVTCVLEWRLALIADPTQFDVAFVTIRGVSDNLPADRSKHYAVLPAVTIPVSPHAQEWEIVPLDSGKARPLLSPKSGALEVTRLEHTTYHVSYRPFASAPEERHHCTPGKHIFTVQRLPLTVFAENIDVFDECALLRGGRLRLRLLMGSPTAADPMEHLVDPPEDVTFLHSAEDFERVLREANPSPKAPWWLQKHTKWTDVRWSTQRQTVELTVRADMYYDPAFFARDPFADLLFPTAAVANIIEATVPATRLSAMPHRYQPSTVAPLLPNPATLYVNTTAGATTSTTAAAHGEQSARGQLSVSDREVARGLAALRLPLRTNRARWSERATDEQRALCGRGVETALHSDGPSWATHRGATLLACDHIDDNSVTLPLGPNLNFTLKRSELVRLVIPKAVICNVELLPIAAPSTVAKAKALATVDWGTLELRRTPLTVDVTPTHTKQCVLSAEPPLLTVDLFGGALRLPAEASTQGLPMEVRRRAHGAVGDWEDERSIEQCVGQLRPVATMRHLRQLSVRLQPCPDLQMRRVDVVDFEFRLRSAAFDGDAVVDLVLNFTVRATRATMAAFSLSRPAPGELRLHPVLPEAGLSEAAIKRDGVVFRITLDGDTWHEDIGRPGATGFNSAFANGFAQTNAISATDAAPWRRATGTRAVSPLLQYLDEMLLPGNVSRVDDTKVELALGPCVNFTAKSRLPCKSLGFGAVENISFAVPGIGTACPGCLVAQPAFIARGMLSSLRAEPLNALRERLPVAETDAHGQRWVLDRAEVPDQFALTFDATLRGRSLRWAADAGECIKVRAELVSAAGTAQPLAYRPVAMTNDATEIVLQRTDGDTAKAREADTVVLRLGLEPRCVGLASEDAAHIAEHTAVIEVGFVPGSAWGFNFFFGLHCLAAGVITAMAMMAHGISLPPPVLVAPLWVALAWLVPVNSALGFCFFAVPWALIAAALESGLTLLFVEVVVAHAAVYVFQVLLSPGGFGALLTLAGPAQL